MEYLIPVSLSVGIFSIILALVSIWLSVTFSRDAQKMLDETREVVKGVDSRVETIEKYTIDQLNKTLTHIMNRSNKETYIADIAKVGAVLDQIKGSPLENVLTRYLERDLERKMNEEDHQKET